MDTRPTTSRDRLAGLTDAGSNQGNFTPTDWATLLATATIWGSSYLWMAIGLDHLHPGVIAFGRMVFGAAVLAFTPSAHKKIARQDWKIIFAVALFGSTIPAVLFPIAQQYVESSVAGMLNSIGPIFTLLISIGLTRKGPEPIQFAGLALGLLGTVIIAYPNVLGAEAQPLGVVLVLFAVLGYSISGNLMPPVAQRYGGPALTLRSLLISSVLLLPFGLFGSTQSTWELNSVGAVVILGVFGTGIARALFATLTGRVGPTRASIVSYLVPLVAIALGVIVRSESVGPLELAGTAMVLAGAWMISRGRAARAAR